MSAPIISLRRMNAGYDNVYLHDYGQVAQGESSTAEQLVFVNNFDGTGGVSDAYDTKLDVYTTAASSGVYPPPSAGMGHLIAHFRMVQAQNVNKIGWIKQEFHFGDGGVTYVTLYNTPTLSGSTPNTRVRWTNITGNDSSTAIVPLTLVNSGSGIFAIQNQNSKYSGSGVGGNPIPIVRLYTLSGATVGVVSFTEGSITYSDGGFTLNSAVTNDTYLSSYAYLQELPYTTGYTVAGAVVTIVSSTSTQGYGSGGIALPTDRGIDVDYLYSSTDTAYTALGWNVAGVVAHRIGGSTEIGNLSLPAVDSDGIPDANDSGTSGTMNRLNSYYNVPSGGAIVNLRIVVPYDAQVQGQDTGLYALTYKY